jgi:hypothetical protein
LELFAFPEHRACSDANGKQKVRAQRGSFGA